MNSINDFPPLPVMTTNTALECPRDVHTTIHYYTPSPDGQPPEVIIQADGKSIDKCQPKDPRSVIIRDVRGREADFTLDQHGFQIRRLRSGETAFDDEERIKAVYYPEIEALLRGIVGEKPRILVASHILR